jgi:hypothetical protein
MCHVASKEGRIKTPRYLAISPDVLELEGIKIALDVANKSGVQILDLDTALESLDVQVLYTRTDWKQPAINERLRAAEKCELLVPECVPVKLIKGAF